MSTSTLLMKKYTYTLFHTFSHSSVESNVFLVGIQKDKTHNEASSPKAIHVKVSTDSIAIYRGVKTG